jgi:ATP-dependent RNA helicase DHX36
MEAIDNNRVLVISGRTGCGKSTQVPKYILAKYPNANIAVCEPRRLAATCLAQRVSEEYGKKLGNVVGYQIGM